MAKSGSSTMGVPQKSWPSEGKLNGASKQGGRRSGSLGGIATERRSSLMQTETINQRRRQLLGPIVAAPVVMAGNVPLLTDTESLTGRHEVRLRFVPPGFHPGLWAAALTLAGLTLADIARRQRSSRH